MLVMFHDDLDGKCSAAIVKKYNPDVRCFPVNYDKPLPIDEIRENEEVVLVDFTPPSREEFEKLLDKSQRFVIWIDHHKKNIDEYPDVDEIMAGLRCDTKPSGAMLTWDYFYSNEECPMAVKYVSDYDTWTYDFGKDTEYFEAGLNCFDMSPESDVWVKLLDNDKDLLKEVIEKGKVISDCRKQENSAYLKKYGYEVEFEGYKCFACNKGHTNSKLFDDVIDDYDFVIPYCFDGKRYLISLYASKEDIDLSKIAAKHGGGGHPSASGFDCEELPF